MARLCSSCGRHNNQYLVFNGWCGVGLPQCDCHIDVNVFQQNGRVRVRVGVAGDKRHGKPDEGFSYLIFCASERGM